MEQHPGCACDPAYYSCPENIGLSMAVRYLCNMERSTSPPPGAAPSSPVHTIWTIGHGQRSIADFLSVLQSASIALLVDVRSYPSSRKHPQFNQDAMRQSITASGISYTHIKELGGRRRTHVNSPHTALTSPGFRGYADHMQTQEFGEGLRQLKALAGDQRVCYCCAETLWWRCHRRMISDRLSADGWTVLHLGVGKEPRRHELWSAARLTAEGELIYDVSADEEKKKEVKKGKGDTLEKWLQKAAGRERK